MQPEDFFLSGFQAQLQRSLDNSVSVQPRPLIGRRSRKEEASTGAQLNPRRQADGTASGQDSGTPDVEDEDDDDDDVRNLQSHTFKVPTLQFLFLFYFIQLSGEFRLISANRCRIISTDSSFVLL